MLISKYKNIHITYPDHFPLSKSNELDILQKLEPYFDNINKRICGKLIKTYTSIRLDKNIFLIIYFNSSREHNPYLYLYNSKEKNIYD